MPVISSYTGKRSGGKDGAKGPAPPRPETMADDVPDRLPLTDAAHELSRLHGVPVSYFRLWAAVIAGRVPAARDGGRWHMNRPDLPVAAEALKLLPARA